MADNFSPDENNVLDFKEQISFDVDETGGAKTVQIFVDCGGNREVVYTAAAYQLEYSGVESLNAGIRSFTFNKTAGWDCSPLSVVVEETDSSTVTTTVNYFVTNAGQKYPPLMQPFNGSGEGCTPGGPAGGDLAGEYPNPEVDGILTHNINPTLVDDGALTYDAAGQGTFVTRQLAGDVTGGITDTRVIRLDGTPLDDLDLNVPQTDEILVWNGTVWVPRKGDRHELVFEWNGTDLSQFNTTAVFVEGTGSPSISIQSAPAGLPFDNVIRVRASKTAGAIDYGAGYLANDALPYPGDNRSLRIEYVAVTGTESGTNTGPGFLYMADDSGSLHAYVMQVSSEDLHKVVAGAASRENDNYSKWGGLSTYVEGTYDIIGRKESSASPEFTSRYDAIENGGGTAYRASYSRGDFDPTPAASWDSLTCTKWGLFTRDFDRTNDLILGAIKIFVVHY